MYLTHGEFLLNYIFKQFIIWLLQVKNFPNMIGALHVFWTIFFFFKPQKIIAIITQYLHLFPAAFILKII